MTHPQAFISTWLRVLQMQEAPRPCDTSSPTEAKRLKHQVSSNQLHPNIDHFNKFWLFNNAKEIIIVDQLSFPLLLSTFLQLLTTATGERVCRYSN